MPTNEITNSSDGSVTIEKFPCKSVATPVRVPRIMTEAPGKGLLFSASFTVPEIFCC